MGSLEKRQTLVLVGSQSAMNRVTKRIGLLDHVGGGNLGDDATLTAVTQNIKTRWPHAQIAGFSMNPTDTEKRHGIPSYAIRRTTLVGSNPFVTYFDLDGDASPPGGRAVSFASRMKSYLRKHRLLFRVLKLLKLTVVRAPETFFAELLFLFKSYRILRSFDLLVISGGGQLLDCWGGPWAFPYTIWKWVFLAKLARVKRVFLNVGAGPLEHPLSIFFIVRALRLADYTSFRDRKSQTLIQQIGFTARSNVVADCVYSLGTPACGIRASGKGRQRHRWHIPYGILSSWRVLEEGPKTIRFLHSKAFGFWLGSDRFWPPDSAIYNGYLV